MNRSSVVNHTVKILGALWAVAVPFGGHAQTRPFPYTLRFDTWSLIFISILLLAMLALWVVIAIYRKVQQFDGPPNSAGAETSKHTNQVRRGLEQLTVEQLRKILQWRRKKLLLLPVGLVTMANQPVFAQSNRGIDSETIWGQFPVLLTLILFLIPIILGITIFFVRIRRLLQRYEQGRQRRKSRELADYLRNAPPEELEELLRDKEQTSSDHLSHAELGGVLAPKDERGLLTIRTDTGPQVAAIKKKAVFRPKIDPALSKLIVWFLISATGWLIFGTTVGEYLGIKFVAPDLDSVSWLSFGRLRPVHTNSVFWGWASMGMMGLAYYVVPRVSNVPLYSVKLGWWSLHLTNATVLLGTISLMAGINNGGGEYREYIWPIMLLFAIALALTLYNFLKTIASRTTREIYISNWYIVAAIIFTIVIVAVAYLPFWQRGLGETIVQGYYMHQGVGMWFMLFMLGIVYYFLPQQLNQPIYSYSLGVLAFWTQILFYTVIGTHHFIFSAIPWWLQTVAIVGSVGMVIPVIAGTTNFLMTFRGAWYKLKDSYTLPFFLVGIIFYFTGSMQGTAEAFRSTNLFWHFTDFTVAHSHITMYGIICFLIWGGVYALLPRLSGQEAPQLTVGAHFWLALIGLIFYTFPLMYGATLRGLHWMEGKPFIESITLMAPYWLWRAIGGSLMWLSHLFFAYNIYKMINVPKQVDLAESTMDELMNR